MNCFEPGIHNALALYFMTGSFVSWTTRGMQLEENMAAGHLKVWAPLDIPHLCSLGRLFVSRVTQGVELSP